MTTIEIPECRTIDFHFNKGHLADPTIPMWVLKAKGQSFYVHHVTSNAQWSTKESPDHPSTKGTIRFRNCSLMIDEQGEATITAMEEIAA